MDYEKIQDQLIDSFEKKREVNNNLEKQVVMVLLSNCSNLVKSDFNRDIVEDFGHDIFIRRDDPVTKKPNLFKLYCIGDKNERTKLLKQLDLITECNNILKHIDSISDRIEKDSKMLKEEDIFESYTNNRFIEAIKEFMSMKIQDIDMGEDVTASEVIDGVMDILKGDNK